MIILLWATTLLLSIAIFGLLLKALMHNTYFHEAIRTITNGIRSAFYECGFIQHKSKYRVELYVWEPRDNVICNQCDDAQERATWEPMDIADWMKKGLPGTPEADTQCGENCQCKLVRYDPSKKTSAKN